MSRRLFGGLLLSRHYLLLTNELVEGVDRAGKGGGGDTITQAMANHIDFLGPSLSLHKKATMVPEKQPRLYIETIIPRMPALGWLATLRKSAFPTMPEKTPWS